MTGAGASDLTFRELRLASMTRPHPPDSTLTRGIDKALAALDAPQLSGALAEMVLQSDRIAMAHAIDLAQAIRDQLDPEKAELRLRKYPPPRKETTK